MRKGPGTLKVKRLENQLVKNRRAKIFCGNLREID
jgi:hypothetical protein